MTNNELREIDKRVAEAMGYNVTTWREGSFISRSPHLRTELPRYTVGWVAMQEMIDWLIAKGWIVDLYYYQDNLWQVSIKTQAEFARFTNFYYPTLPRAVCDAVLYAAQEAK